MTSRPKKLKQKPKPKNKTRMSGIMKYSRGNAVLLGILLGCILGCNKGDLPDLAPVHGIVTLAETPLANKEVIFAPENGRASVGRTDENGKYKLKYTVEINGAIIGLHAVKISTPLPEGGNYAGYKETVPKKYNVESTLKEEVKSGHNTKNFDLKSK